MQSRVSAQSSYVNRIHKAFHSPSEMPAATRSSPRNSTPTFDFVSSPNALTEITNATGATPTSAIKPSPSVQPPPPPPPLSEEVVVATPPSMLESTVLPFLRFEHPLSAKSCAAANVAMAFFAFGAASPVSLGAWAMLAFIVYNGWLALKSGPPAATKPLAKNDLVCLLPYLNAIKQAYEGVVKGGEPKMALRAALGAYAVALVTARVSAVVLLWAALVAAFTLPTAIKHVELLRSFALGKVDQTRAIAEAAVAKHSGTLGSLQQQAASMIPEVESKALLTAKEELTSWASWGASLGYKGLIPIGMVTWYNLSYFHKGLSMAFGVLAYNAFVSPEGRVANNAATSSITQKARRMTMGAKDLVFKSKEV